MTKFRSIFIRDIIMRPVLTMKIKEANCKNSKIYKKNGYLFNFGVIGIAKKDFNKRVDSMNDDWSTVYSLVKKYEYNTALRDFALEKEINQTLETYGVEKSTMQSFFIECCYTPKQDKCFVNRYINGHSEQLFYSNKLKKNAKTIENYVFKQNVDTLSVQVFSEYVNGKNAKSKEENKSVLKFIKNGNVELTSMEIDCQKYSFVYALSSACCDCSDKGNFSFEIW